MTVHHYPKEFFFSITNHGIGGLVKKWGDGASLVRPAWKPRERQLEGAGERKGKAALKDHGGEEGDVKEGGESEDMDDMDDDLEVRKPEEGDITGKKGEPSLKTEGTRGKDPPPHLTVPPTHRNPSSPPAEETRSARVEDQNADMDVDSLAEAFSQKAKISMVPMQIRFGRSAGKARVGGRGAGLRGGAV